MPQIHPTAVIEPGARIAPDATIGPLCHIGPKAIIGQGCRLMGQVTILGRTTLGRDNVIWPQVVLGADPQDLKFKGEDVQLILGDRNIIRELVTMHLGTAAGGGLTQVGHDNLIMVGVHVAHDCILGNHLILANSIGLAGHVRVEDYANLGGVVGVHHFVTIGRHAFVGGMTRLVHDVPPYMMVEGNPAVVRGVNVIGLERFGLSGESIQRLKEAYRRLYRKVRGQEASPTTMNQRLALLEKDYPGDPHIATLIAFLRQSSQGHFGRYQESFRTDSRRRRLER